jgi:hypothetical protein
MNRRGFLGALFGLAAAPVLAKLSWARELGLGEEFHVEPLTLGAGFFTNFYVCGYATEPEVAPIYVLRRDGTKLLDMTINAYGGSLNWFDWGGSNSIYFDESFPIFVSVPKNVRAQMVWTDRRTDQSYMRTFERGVVTRGDVALRRTTI